MGTGTTVPFISNSIIIKGFTLWERKSVKELPVTKYGNVIWAKVIHSTDRT